MKKTELLSSKQTLAEQLNFSARLMARLLRCITPYVYSLGGAGIANYVLRFPEMPMPMTKWNGLYPTDLMEVRS